MSLKKIFLSLFSLLSVSGLVNTSAVASEAMLRNFFSEITTLQASFKQQVVDETGFTLERSSGTVYLSRPGQFRWDYFSSDTDANEASNVVEVGVLNQQILADGQFIYLYDPELEQATRRSLRDALAQVPSLLLVQTGANVDEHFEIVDFGVTDGLSWVALNPKDVDAAYQQLMIGFKEGGLAAIELLDGLGNETRLVLENVKTNIALDSQTFSFAPPAGVDLLTE